VLTAYIGPQGVGEGISAVDRFRLSGHPLVKGHDVQAPDLNGITLSRPGGAIFGAVSQGPGRFGA